MYLYPVLLLVITSPVRLLMCSLHYIYITFLFTVIPAQKQVATNIFQIQKFLVALITGITLHWHYLDFYRF